MRKQVVRTVLCLTLSVMMTTQPATAKSGEAKTVAVNGFDMTYVEKGEGPLMVLVHGSFSDNRTWKDQIELLSKDFRVIAPTMRYFGKAAWSESWPKFSDALLADDLVEFVKALDSGPAHIVGWSRGGRVSHLAMLKHPEVVQSAYLYEGAVRIKLDGEDAEIAKRLSGKIFGPAVKVLKEKGPLASVPFWVDGVAGAGAYEQRSPEQKEMFKDNARTIPITMAGKRTFMVCKQIQSNKVPTVMYGGTKSAFVAIFKPYQECFGKSFVTIEGATHSWPGMDKEAFANSVTAFALKH